eukprot:TRINITY_DN6243_c0_g1_i1.p1 TRINITY_DN6243_c0_g1~~TRINITY_DN6243_c0_g1_i1.p1  ORF type:complete len:173 (-),score=22.72 TRINITY_DN6243_c0_g1_i1:104-553(-)
MDFFRPASRILLLALSVAWIAGAEEDISITSDCQAAAVTDKALLQQQQAASIARKFPEGVNEVFVLEDFANASVEALWTGCCLGAGLDTAARTQRKPPTLRKLPPKRRPTMLAVRKLRPTRWPSNLSKIRQRRMFKRRRYTPHRPLKIC